MDYSVVIENLTKTFFAKDQEDITAVDGISLQIPKGEIFTFVGPDGAGKTTTIRMMCGLIPPTSGSINILGLDVQKERDRVKPYIGYLSQRFSLYNDLSIDENIDFFAGIHRLKDFQKRKEELLAFTRLTPFRSRLAGRLSGGMKQKLALACTLIHTPEIIILDEPTTGVDPLSRRDFWKILSDVLKSGITIISATPYLDEAERSNCIALMDKGKILASDLPENVKKKFPFRVFEIICSDSRKAVECLKAFPDCKNVQLFGDRLHISISKDREAEIMMINQMQNKEIEISSIREVSPSLEDVFIWQMSS